MSAGQAIRVVAAVGQGAHDVVHLVDVFFQADIERARLNGTRLRVDVPL